MAVNSNTLLVATRKGLLTFSMSGGKWKLAGTAHEGIPIAYAIRDLRNGTYWASLEHGHWGAKLHRSDNGTDWEELKVEYPSTALDKEGEPVAMESIWYVGPGGADQPNRIYLGTHPGGLFRSDDGGKTFDLVTALWKHPSRPEWFGGGRNTPGIHTVVVDPRDSTRVLIGVSCGGVFETTDDGETWVARNKGLAADFLPDPTADTGQDPHFFAMSPANPDVLWQQNHCGVYRSTDGGQQWDDVGDKDIGVHFGFPVTTHPERPESAWVVPAVSDEKRMAVGGALRVCRTEDGGKSWTPLTKGLPQQMAYDVVYRHALDQVDDVLAFGSTTGNLYFSADGGESWETLGNNLPPVYSVRFVRAG